MVLGNGLVTLSIQRDQILLAFHRIVAAEFSTMNLKLIFATAVEDSVRVISSLFVSQLVLL
jgi:hypothetical protein